MAVENWQQVRKIFDEALRQEPEKRREFVRRACGKNKSLLADIESLLESLDSADKFLEKPALANLAGQILTENRQFEVGQFLNHYQVIKQIGVGGMGEVYLAHDTRLNRKVALKILRKNPLSEDHSNRRLLREAQAAALLDHPNICAIYEISESDDCSFIVMQYVEGQTLAEHLANERLTVENSVDLAIQIADALVEAHSRGLIHRDIKPANIIISDRGQAKVLDFGLAKFIENQADIGTSKRLHSSGAVMGTMPFMSPEQLCAKQLDARTDIFSLGVLVYEMLCGKSAFAGESNAETISAILNNQPDLTAIPKILQPIIRKCLMKKSDERYQTANDLIRDLVAAKQSGEFLAETEPAQTKAVPTASLISNSSHKAGRPASKLPFFHFWKSSEQNVSISPETTRLNAVQTVETKRTRMNWVTTFLSAVMIILIGGVTYFAYRQLYKPDDSRQFDAMRPVRLIEWKAAPGGYYTDYRVSNDGKFIAYSSSQEGGKENIYVKQTADGAEIRVTKDEWTNISPVWSPDDQSLSYVSLREGKTGIYLSPALGGQVVPLKIIGSGEVFLRHWSKDGKAIFYEYQGNLFRFDRATQETTQITDFAPSPGTERYFSLSPHENRIAFCDKTDGQIDVWTMTITGGEKQRLTNDRHKKSRPRWHPDGTRILYNIERDNDQQISLAYTDERPSVQLTRGDGDYQIIDVSTDGTRIFYFSLEDNSDISGINVETGEEFEVATNRDYENWADISPDGKSILYQTKTAKNLNKILIVVKPIGSHSPTLTVEGYNPRWLPDSRRISFIRWFENEQKYFPFVVNSATGEEKQITTGGVATPSHSNLPKNRGEIGVEDWSPDSGKFVYLNAGSPKNVWTTSLESGENVNLTNNEHKSLRYNSPLFSADGKRLVFISRETTSEKMVYKLWLWENGTAKEIFSLTGGLRLLGWTDSGNEVLLETTEGVMKETPLEVKLLRIGLTGESQIVTTFKNIYADTMTLSSDGKMVAFTARQNDKDDIWTVPVKAGEPKKLTSNGSERLYYASLTWSPDGKTIYFDKQEQIDTISMFENFK